MPTLQIRARFPLGVYRGHVGRGRSLSTAPETSRLFRALVHAAGTGSTAVVEGRHLRPSPEAVEALAWLESNPPVGLVLPDVVAVNLGYDSYRAEGVFEGSGNRTDRKVVKTQSDGVALPSSSGWEWRWEDVPDVVVRTVDQLCADVSCLGEADCPVVLEMSHAAPTHAVALDVGRLTPGPYTRVVTPMPGHFDELEDAHRATESPRPPTKDTFGWGGRPGAPAPTSERTREVAYRLIHAADRPPSPWPFALHIPLAGAGSAESVSEHDLVRWASAMHAALASRLGDEAPPVVTGRYERNAIRPANRVAIHLLPQQAGSVPPGFLALLPLEVEERDVARLQQASASLRTVYIRKPPRADGPQELRVGRPTTISTEGFWTPPGQDERRLFSPVPSLVPEVTRQSKSWTLADAVLLSVGFLLRDRFTLASGRQRYRGLVDQVRAAGVRVHRARGVPSSRTEDFVHRMTKGVPVRPTTALVDMGGLVPDTALFALGQSRHLGGGLMRPVDLPASLVETWETPDADA